MNLKHIVNYAKLYVNGRPYAKVWKLRSGWLALASGSVHLIDVVTSGVIGIITLEVMLVICH